MIDTKLTEEDFAALDLVLSAADAHHDQGGEVFAEAIKGVKDKDGNKVLMHDHHEASQSDALRRAVSRVNKIVEQLRAAQS